MKNVIDSFSGKYRFLSNFFPSKVRYEGEVYPTVEHAYQAAKTTDESQRLAIRLATTPGRAKRLGKKATLRPGWEEMKISVMRSLLEDKFSGMYFSTKLQGTGQVELIEGNWWDDTFWGVCDGVGQNHLGKLLMEIRERQWGWL